MSVREHRITIFLNDEELRRIYNAAAKKKITPARLLRKALFNYIEELEREELIRREYEEVSSNII